MTRSPALMVYLLASRLAGPMAGSLLRRRLARGKEDAARLGERLGQAGRARPDGPLIWLHGASVGEAMSMLPLIDAIRQRSRASILITTVTVTSARRIGALLPDGACHQFVPVDTARAVGRFLDHWRPDLAVWIESELWPRLVHETARRGIPAALINARVSEKSMARWRRAPGMARDLLGAFRVILTQDEETRERLASIGVDARFGGNLKALVPSEPVDAAELAELRMALGPRPVWLAASTHAGEEEQVLAAHRRVIEAGSKGLEPVLILAPRHPERRDEVTDLLRHEGLAFACRSDDRLPGSDTQVFLADTLGEMALWYRLAPVTFVGGSLVDKGGHTPFEPVQLGSAVIHGPHTGNFAPAYRALADAGAARCVDGPADLSKAVMALLAGDDGSRTEQVKRAHAVHVELKPDVGEVAEEVLSLMEASA